MNKRAVGTLSKKWQIAYLRHANRIFICFLPRFSPSGTIKKFGMTHIAKIEMKLSTLNYNSLINAKMFCNTLLPAKRLNAFAT